MACLFSVCRLKNFYMELRIFQLQMSKDRGCSNPSIIRGRALQSTLSFNKLIDCIILK